MKRVLATAAFAVLLLTAASAGADGLEGMAPVSDADLGGVAIGNSLLNLNAARNTTEQTDNEIRLDHGSSIRNGRIRGQVKGNRGITNAFFNTGNLVSMSNATIVNVILNNNVGAGTP